MISRLLHSSAEFVASCLPRPAKQFAHKHAPSLIPGLYRMLRGVTPRNDLQIVIQNGILKGRAFCCSLRDERDYWLGTWEPETQDCAREWIRPGFVVFDVGVHKGFFTLLAASLVKDQGRVVAFEPHPGNRRMTLSNTALNQDLATRIKVEPLAISDQTGTERFECGHDGSSTAALTRAKTGGDSGGVEVQTVTLDEYIATSNIRPDFIKMDIEGAEKFALRGMIETLAHVRPAVLIEIHDSACSDELQRCLREHRYVAKRLNGEAFHEQVAWKGRDQFLLLPAESGAR